VKSGDGIEAAPSFPDFALLNPGYKLCEADLSEEPRQAPPPVALRSPFRASCDGACHSSGAEMRRENDDARPPPRKRGRGTARSVVEGACDAKLHLRSWMCVEGDAPSTALRAVPLPR
jgi:hypothetical protein